MEADLVITKDGYVVKDRWGALSADLVRIGPPEPEDPMPPTEIREDPTPTGIRVQHIDFGVPSLTRRAVEKALQCLSGDLNYNNVGEAKQILKSLLK
jgi:hypothetical protein